MKRFETNINGEENNIIGVGSNTTSLGVVSF